MNAATNPVTNSIKTKKISNEKNNQYVKKYRETHRESFNAYMAIKVKERYNNSEDVRIKHSIYGKMRWYNIHIKLLEEKEELTKRETNRLIKLQNLKADLERKINSTLEIN